MIPSYRKFSFFICNLIICLLSSLTQADSHNPLICSVSDSRDYFQVYPSQLIYSSDKFSYYQLIGGLTVLVVNKNTMRFNRLSNLNLLQNSTMDPNKSPENYQLFNGLCKFSETKENYKLKD